LEQHFAHQHRVEGHVRRVSALGPSTRTSRRAAMAEAGATLQWLELGQQVASFGRLERRRMTDVMEDALPVIQAEEERSDAVTRFREPVTADDTVDGPFVLDLDHHPLARLVRLLHALGHHTIEAGALEPLEPVTRR